MLPTSPVRSPVAGWPLWAGLGLLFVLPFPSLAAAQAASAGRPAPAPRLLGLRETLELALRSDPSRASAVASRERGELAVRRAQLDRFSLRVDSFLTEQWRASNLGGSTPSPSCAALLPTAALTGSGSLVAPVQLLSVQGGGIGAPSAAECQAVMGQYYQPDTIGQGWLGQFNLSANLQVPLFSGFRVSANVDRARHLHEAAAATVSDTERSVALAALRAYWLVRRLEVQQEVSEQAIVRYGESVQVVTARVRAGLAAQADINRIETRRQAELARLADLVGSAAEARAQLAVALGLGGLPLTLTESVELLPAPPTDAEQVESLLSGALTDRPDLRAARLTTLAAADFVRIQLSSYYPQLSASSLLQFSNNPYNPLVGARDANASANPFANITGSVFFGGTLSLNLFDTLNTWTGVRDARLDHKRLTEEERRIGRLIESDVRTLHARLQKLYGTREPLLRTRDIARDSLDITAKRYKNGDVAILDFIDAQVELLNAEINLANSAATIAQTWGETYLATGRLPPTTDR
jgi:outer membrane protein TolC